MVVVEVFRRAVEAMGAGVLIRRESRSDKEFHFQNWFQERLSETGRHFEAGGRNSYPDFRIVKLTEGFEVKGLAYPGRDASFDSNSQIPSGFHNGRTIYYVFGRYPKDPDGNTYPVVDLVLCHGDFLNADHGYMHKNKSVRHFGSYGDILIRDRKMYVVPTPFKIAEGLAHHATLVLPNDVEPGPGFQLVGQIRRRGADSLIVGYSFDLLRNVLTPQAVPNPNAGTEHVFRAWRVDGAPSTPVNTAANVPPVAETGDDAES
jgi:hypothetical protein